MPTADPQFIEKILAYYRDASDWHPDFVVLAMQEYAPGVVAVFDAFGEYDVLFDETRWAFARPEIWDALPEKPDLKALGVLVLEGIGQAPPPSDFGQMLAFAKRQLTSMVAAWHETPVAIKIE